MCPPSLPAQSQSNVLSVAPPKKVTARRGSILEIRVPVQLKDGYHVNSHTPSEDYLIPLRLTWESKPFEVSGITYPQPKLEKYQFTKKPISVFTGDFEIVTRFKVPADAPRGPGIVLGKLRYQACNHNSCLPPKTVEVRLPYEIR